MKIQLRPFTPSDQTSLIDLWNNVFPNPRAHNLPQRIIAEKCAVQAGLLLLAVQNDRVIGSIIAGYDGHRGWLNLVAVLPEYQRQGVGKQLVEYAFEKLSAAGCSKVNIQIREGNEAVITFYQRMGFAIEPRVSMGRFI